MSITTEGTGGRRHPRYESHALVEVRMSKWNPFSVQSAVLIDISWEGFKIEFVSSRQPIRMGSRLRMDIPLAPFNIETPRTLRLDLIIKWFDPRMARAGGVFQLGNQDDKQHLEKVIHFIAARSAEWKK